MSVLTICAVANEDVPRSALEALAAARHLADALGGEKVQVLLTGSGVTDHGASLIEWGADEVLVVDDGRLETLDGELVLAVVEKAVEEATPDIVIFPHTDLSGGHVAPRLPRRLETGIVTDCTGFGVEGEVIHWVRPVYGGKAMAVMTVSGPIQLATMRSLAFEPLEADESREGEMRELGFDLDGVTVEVPIVDTIVQEEAFERPSLALLKKGHSPRPRGEYRAKSDALGDFIPIGRSLKNQSGALSPGLLSIHRFFQGSQAWIART